MNDATIDRRSFLAATAAGIATSTLHGVAQAQLPPEALALDGGPRSVPPRPVADARFGGPEKEQLEAMLGQDTLLYWKAPQTTAFVERFRAFTPLEHVMTCSSGTAALHIAVCAAGIAPGDEVITSPITDIGTVIGVLYQQAVPVFADLGASTVNLDPASVEARISPRTKAIIAVHLAGNPCPLQELREIADRHQLVLIEDCAQAWGAQYRGKPIGTLGDIACWSLQNSKHVTCGDGGVVASSHPVFGPLLQPYGDKGVDRTRPRPFEIFSTNYRMSEPQAAVAAGQLTRLESIVEKRARLGRRFGDGITGIRGIAPHEVHPEDRSSYWFYMFRFDPAAYRVDRAAFVKALAAEGVPCSAGYIPVLMQKNPVFLNHGFFAGRWPAREMGLTAMDYNTHETPVAQAILDTGIRMTVHESMDDTYIDHCAEAVRKVAAHYAA